MCLKVANMELAKIWTILVPTATFAGMPKVKRNGVIMKPPPNPKNPDRSPTMNPMRIR
jgi:hypothetical protein